MKYRFEIALDVAAVQEDAFFEVQSHAYGFGFVFSLDFGVGVF